MESILKRLVLAGIGTMTFTYEKASGLVEEMVRKGELTVAQGREMNEELKRKGQSGEPQTGATPAPETIREAVAGLNLATRDELASLEARISRLEAK